MNSLDSSKSINPLKWCILNFEKMKTYKKILTLSKSIGLSVISGLIGSKLGMGTTFFILGGTSSFCYLTYEYKTLKGKCKSLTHSSKREALVRSIKMDPHDSGCLSIEDLTMNATKRFQNAITNTVSRQRSYSVTSHRNYN